MVWIRCRDWIGDSNPIRTCGMDENPYTPPEHYTERRESEIPWTAYVVVGGLLATGAGISLFGFYYLLPRMALGGLFWFGIGLLGAYFVVSHRQKPK